MVSLLVKTTYTGKFVPNDSPTTRSRSWMRRLKPPIREGSGTPRKGALALLSIGYANDKGEALKESLKWLELLLVVLVIVDLVHDQRATWWIIGPMFLAGAAEATSGAIQFVD